MQSSWLNQINSWNPQLVREWRGRLKTRSVVAAIVLSVIAQILLCLIHLDLRSGLDSQGQWLRIWQTLTWLFPYVLFCLGGYYIVSDITQEEKRGTLNFIRLSPRPGWQILLGKVLGVPTLPYLTIGTVIPLHLLAAFQAQISSLFMVSYYLMLLGGCFLCYSLALLAGLVGSYRPSLINQPTTVSFSFGAIAFFALSPLFMSWNLGVTWQGLGTVAELSNISNADMYWSFIPITAHPALAHGFTLINMTITAGLIWRMLLRRFRQPRSSFMSKRQSYGIVAYVEFLVIGFTLRPGMLGAVPGALTTAALSFYLISIALIAVVIFAIVSPRQSLLDWSNYQSQGLQSWIWADKSPMPLALIIHLLLIYALLIPWTFASGIGFQDPIGTLVSFASVAMTIMMCGLLTQIIFASRIRNPGIWAVSSLFIWFAVPPAIMGTLRLVPDQVEIMTITWTFFGYPVWHFQNLTLLRFTVVGMILQGLVLGCLLWRFFQTLQRLHQSQRLS